LGSLRRGDRPSLAQPATRLRDDRAGVAALLFVPFAGVKRKGEAGTDPDVDSQVLQHGLSPRRSLLGRHPQRDVDGL